MPCWISTLLDKVELSGVMHQVKTTLPLSLVLAAKLDEPLRTTRSTQPLAIDQPRRRQGRAAQPNPTRASAAMYR